MKDLNYDSALKELESILQSLQKEEIELEKMQTLIQRAKELNEFCRQRLQAIETDVKNLDKTEEG